MERACGLDADNLHMSDNENSAGGEVVLKIVVLKAPKLMSRILKSIFKMNSENS